MNECPEHWAALRAEIERRGLSAFILTGRENFDAAVRVIQNAKEGKPAERTLRLDEFDPLLTASNMIFGQAMHHAGMRLLAPDPATGKPRCPLCMVAGDHVKGWIEGAVGEAARMVCRLQKGPVHFDEKGMPLDPLEPDPSLDVGNEPETTGK